MAEPPTSPTAKCTQAAALELLDCSTGAALDSKGLTIHALLAALTGAFASFGAQILIFSVVRSKCPRVYQHRTIPCQTPKASPRFLKGTARWIFPLFSLPSKVVLETCGLDAFFFLRYMRLLIWSFLPLSVVVTPTLAAINRYASPASLSAQGLDRFSLSNISRETHDVLWAHLILAVGAVSWFCFVIHNELMSFVKIRHEHLQSSACRAAKSTRTILVTNIPQEILNVNTLQRLYSVYPGGVSEININRDHRVLSKKIAQCKKLRDHIEKIETSRLRVHVKKLSERGDKHLAKSPAQERMSDSSKQTAGNAWISEEHFRASLTKWKTYFSGEGSRSLGSQMNVTDNRQRWTSAIMEDSPKVAGHGSCARMMKALRNLTLRKINGGDREDPALATKIRQTSNDAKQGSPDSRTLSIELPLPVAPCAHFDSHEGIPQFPCTQWMRDRLDRAFYWPACRGIGPQGDSGDRSHEKSHEALPQAKQSFQSPLRTSAQARETYKACCNSSLLGSCSCHIEDLPNPGNVGLPEHHRRTSLLLERSMQPYSDSGGASLRSFCWRNKLMKMIEQIHAERRNTEQREKLSSAFVTFFSQAAAHMACQNLVYHEPLKMTSSIPDIAPSDVLWENLARSRPQQLVRKWVSSLLCAGVVLLYTIPVSFASMLAQLDKLARTYPWLAWLDDLAPVPVAIIQGVLPPLLVGIMLVMIPPLIRKLASLQGVLTGRARERLVQSWYFAFLFVQCFLVVTVSGGLSAFFSELASEPGQAVNNLSKSLPKAANYFFSYLTVQALSSSASALLQVGSLGDWLLLGPAVDSTPRQKWKRQEKLGEVRWGTMFPPLSNIATIGIVYSVIAPLMLIFMTFIFSLFWVVYRYNVLYVYRYDSDYGGLMFPTAVHQLFTGLYVVEACLAAYFFTVTSASGHLMCVPQGVIMSLSLLATGFFQWQMVRAFGRLCTFFPISLASRDQSDYSSPGPEQRSSEQGKDSKTDLEAAEPDRNVTDRSGELGMHQLRDDDVVWQSRESHQANSQLHSTHAKPREDPVPPLKRWRTSVTNDYQPSEPLSFAHPATQTWVPVVWIPKDPFGVSEELLRSHSHFSPHGSERGRSSAYDKVSTVYTSHKGASLDTRGRVRVLGRPPTLLW